MKKYYLQAYRHTLLFSDDENTWVSVENLEIHPQVAEHLAEMGVIEIHRGMVSPWEAGRIQKLMKLRRNLGVNLSGAAIILELLDRIEELQDEIEGLKRR